MNRNALLASGLAGFGSFALFIGIYGFGMSVPLALLPTFPLFIIGLSKGLTPLLVATGMAAALLAMIADLSGIAFYTLFLAIPALLFAPQALSRDDGSWRPIGSILTDLTVYAALAYLAAQQWIAGDTDMQTLISTNIRQSFVNAEPEVLATVDRLATNLAFVVVAAGVWWWVGLTYAHAWFANWILKLNQQHIRPSLALSPFPMPLWILGACAASGIASVFYTGEAAFTARILLLIFLLPYFLLGASTLHQKLRNWPNRGLLLFLLYLFIISQAWPALAVAALGFWQHCREISARFAEQK